MSPTPNAPRGRQEWRHPYTTHHPEVDERIEELVKPFTDPYDRRLLTEMMVSVYRLGEDAAATGDMKIINAALKELRYAFKVFRPYRHMRKVAMFGSARLQRAHPAYAMARAFGRSMAKEGWGVITGAASGIMRAGHEGAGRAASFGLNIRLPFEQEANPIIAEDKKLITCKYFFTRKLLFIKESHATVLFPGGFGTLDEGFETLTLVQTGKADPRPIVFVDPPRSGYWQPLLRFVDRQMLGGGMVSSADRAIYSLVHSEHEAVEYIKRFYSVYHSMRYVRQVLVIRLNQALPESAARDLTSMFRDLLVSGTIQQVSALPEEADEPELAHLPRLVLLFNRRSFGGLAELVHAINAFGEGGRMPRRHYPPEPPPTF